MEEVWPSTARAERPSGPCAYATVVTNARLHFGFFDPSGKGPRPFGSFGLALDRPRTKLTLRRKAEFSVRGEESGRAEHYLHSLAKAHGLSGAYALDIEEAVPPHAGLGSGTQLALAVGLALAALEGLPIDLKDIAARLGRGRRSGLGIGTFESGGVVVDGGPGPDALPPILCRLPFPAEWRVLLIFDPGAAGIHGADEVAAFASLPEFPIEKTAELCRRVLLGALPALAESDFAAFSAEVDNLQDIMGTYFADLQGGRYTSPAVAKALAWLKSLGITGLGQSSWGPTGFAFVASEAGGQALMAQAQARPELTGLRFELAQGCNEGARLKIG